MKTWKGSMETYSFTWDVASSQGGAVGEIALGNLPEGFVVCRTFAAAITALTGGGSAVVGQGAAASGDVDGYFTDIDAIAVATPIRGTGALVLAASGLEPLYKIPTANTLVAVTVATTAYTVGKVQFFFEGFQA